MGFIAMKASEGYIEVRTVKLPSLAVDLWRVF